MTAIMRWRAPLAAAMLALSIVACVPPAAAFDEMSGITMAMSPQEATSGARLDLVVTLGNQNDRDLTITSLTAQIYNGGMFSPEAKYEMYHINPSEGLVPANGTRSFELGGNAPKYVGMCSVAVTIAGVFEGDENASIDILFSSITLNPDVRGFMLTGALLFIIPLAIAVAAVAVVIWHLGKSRGGR